MMNEKPTVLVRPTAVFSILFVVLSQHGILFFMARRLARAIAEAGLSLALPLPTAILTQRPWILLVSGTLLTAWAIFVALRSNAALHICSHLVIMATIAVSLQLFSLRAFDLQWMGGLSAQQNQNGSRTGHLEHISNSADAV